MSIPTTRSSATAPVMRTVSKVTTKAKIAMKKLSHEKAGGRESISFVPSTIKVSVDRCPPIIIAKSAYDDMRMLVDECDIEIGWMGLVEKTAQGFYLSEIFVPKQKCHEARTRFDDGAMFDIIKDLKKRKIDPACLRLWGHSHVRFAPEPSHDDWRQIDEFSNSDWMITVIANKDGDIKFQVHLYEFGVTLSDVPWSVPSDSLEDSLRAATRKIILDNVGELEKPEPNFEYGYGREYRPKPFDWDDESYDEEKAREFAERMGRGEL